MASKKPPRRRKRKRTKSRHKSRAWLRITQLFTIVICISAGYIVWLDYRIQIEFEGDKWDLPARVYASPLELYPGRTISLHRLEKELIATRFEQSDQLDRPGQYKKTPNALEFIKRQFEYGDKKESAQAIRVIFDHGQIEDILDSATNAQLSWLRLEPQLIGKIYPAHNEDRILVKLSDVPALLIKALIAVEDRNFLEHHGIDPRGIFRAILTNLSTGEISQGGSTLTQQLVKNFFLTSERTLWRKLNEMVMAILLEVRFSKEEILSAYINEVYLGQHGSQAIHGFGTAAEFYFGRPLQELRDDEIALLVGIIRGASYYNPRKHPQRALQRRNLVLQLIREQGFISQPTEERLRGRGIELIEEPNWSRAKYPAFLDLVRRQLLHDYNLRDLQNEGLRIFTTLEPEIQDQAEQHAREKLARLEKYSTHEQDPLQMAVVIQRISSGEVIAVIGGRERHVQGFNRALDAKRPIGSLIKPIVYLTALSRPSKYNLLTRLDDSPLSVKQPDGRVWRPHNYDRQNHGEVMLIEALKHSYNLASIRLGLSVGLDEVIKTIEKTGIKASIKSYPSLLLGAFELTPMEVSQMYQTIANGGFMAPVNSIREVFDNQGSPLQRHGLKIRQTLAAGPVFLTNFILAEAVKSGTGASLIQTFGSAFPLAGKTGTTNDLRDSWFAGYGDDLLMVTWLGRDDNHPSGFSGATGAMQIWSAIMQSLAVQPLQLIAPEEIEWVDTQGKTCAGLSAIPALKGTKKISLAGCTRTSRKWGIFPVH